MSSSFYQFNSPVVSLVHGHGSSREQNILARLEWTQLRSSVKLTAKDLLRILLDRQMDDKAS